MDLSAIKIRTAARAGRRAPAACGSTSHGLVKKRSRRTSEQSCHCSLDVKKLNRPGPIMTQILQKMAGADVVIFDLTGGNPNVFYELGIAHLAKGSDKVILLKQESSEVPFDVQGYRFLPYTADGLKSLHPRLMEHVKAAAQKTFWFPLAENDRKEFATLRGRDGFFYRVEVHMLAFAHEAVRVELIISSHPPDLELPPTKKTLSIGKSCPIPKLPWRLRFEHLEHIENHGGQREAILCLIPAHRGGRTDRNAGDAA